jgi:hypothetical protein
VTGFPPIPRNVIGRANRALTKDLLTMDDLRLCPGCFVHPAGDARCRCGYEPEVIDFPSALRPGTVLSRYMLGRVLGRPGGFGITYLAFDPVLNRRLAVKELMPRELVARRPDGHSLQVHTKQDETLFQYTRESFLNEARLVAQFNHPNLVRVLDFFEANGTAYFAMEYYEGETLAEYVHRSGGRLGGDEAVRLVLPLLDALDHIHSFAEPVLHRDIKPTNIYVTGGRTPILLDFGAARVALGQQSQSLSAVLTPGYAPFEQYSSRGNQGPWTDVYGCAATLYFLVTGQAPPEASLRVEEEQVQPPHRLVPELGPALGEAIVRGLGFKPRERPATARAFADLLTGRAAAATELAPDSAVAGRTALAPADATAKGTALAPEDAAEGAVGDPLDRTQLAPNSTADRGAPGWATAKRTEVAPQDRATDATELAPGGGGAAPVAGAGRRGAWSWPVDRRAQAGVLAAAAVLLVAGVGLAVGVRSGEPDGPPPVDAPAFTPPPRADDDPTTTRQAPPPREPDATTGGGGGAPEAPVARAPGPSAAGDGSGTVGVPDGAATPPRASPPDPSPTASAGTGILVVVYGDEPSSARQVETVFLRSLDGRAGLRALDAHSLGIIRGDQAALDAALRGDIGALAALGRRHGAELLVIADLSARAAPSVNRFFAGTAEIDVKMYRASSGSLVDARTFRVGAGGQQNVLATSEAEARAGAARRAADGAAPTLASWVTRAFR